MARPDRGLFQRTRPNLNGLVQLLPLLFGERIMATGEGGSMQRRPGLVVLFGSGEASPEAQPIHDFAMRSVDQPIRAAVVETPAGFELNSAQVSGRLADYLRVRLQNYHPEVAIVPARKRGTPFSPDDPDIVAPLLTASYIMMGPGSPSYAVRQLANSLAWHAMLARHRLGYPLVFASAATIAASAVALPVYEIYKVGEDPHWKPGLDLFGPYGAKVAFIPHWDNRDGGDELDTSHCFLGEPRYVDLVARLNEDVLVVGIDEKTAFVVDFAEGHGRVMGAGGITLIRKGETRRFGRREAFPLAELGLRTEPDPKAALPASVWEAAVTAEAAKAEAPEPPAEVQALVESRAKARAARDWAAADRLRSEIARLGWQVNDLPTGSQLVPLNEDRQ
jgi:cyanophycinase-like exopeptidase